MKKILNILSLLFVSLCFSQTNLTSSENYIYSKSCLTKDCSKASETVQYFDSWGKPIQVIDIKATPQGKDMVSHIEYDPLGRQVKNYLPVPQAGTQNGSIYTSPLANANAVYGSEKIYSEKILENSPLERVLQQIEVGNQWTGKPVNFNYDANTDGEITRYTVSTSWLEGRTKYEVTKSGTFSGNTLAKNTITNEDGNISTAFKNKKGQTILIRKKVDGQNADTYYLYNEFNQLAYVIPPLASQAGSVDQTTLDNLCYQYHYDGWNRLVEKKIPGKGWEYFVYDRQDRLVATQDANLKAKGQWLYTKYDQFSRVIMTGICQAMGSTRLEEQNYVNTKGSNSETRSSGVSMNYSGMDIYYSVTQGYPQYDKVYNFLSLNYYDTYPVGTPAIPPQVLGENTLQDNVQNSIISTKGLATASYVKNTEASDIGWTKKYIYYDTKGRVVSAHSINHLGGYTRTESELDFIGMVKQSKVYHKRISSDTEKVIIQTYEYDNGNRLKKQWHQVNGNPQELLKENTYNELSQLTNKKVGNNLQSIDYAYNIRGWMTKVNDPSNLDGKLFGYEMKYTNPVNTNITPGIFSGNIAEIDWNNASENILKRYNYTYDGLDRLKNGVYSEPNSSVPFNNYFNESPTYDLNGNIKTLQRNAFPVIGVTATQADNLEYQYTGNRLDKVIEKSLNNTGYEGGNNLIDYDQNGNMTSMKDKGIQNMTYNFLDLPGSLFITQTSGFGAANVSLDYLYSADGTKLRKTYSSGGGKLTSSVIRLTDYLDGFQYTYTEKSLACITCRTEVAYEEQAYKSIALEGGIGWILDFVPTSEGYYSFRENRYIYLYNDHLGNARVSFVRNSAGAPEIIDTNNYYPFGLNHIGGSFSSKLGSPYSYKYNGKELQETGMYDYGWRQYMPDLGRWNGMDKLAEKYYSTSPNAYVMNNPVMSFDPDGREIKFFGGGIDPSTTIYGGDYSGISSFSPFGGYSGMSGGLAFGKTQAYGDLMNALQNGGDFSLKTHNGYMSWWTGGAAGNANTSQEMIAHMLNLNSYEYDSEMHKTSQTLRTWSGYAFSANKFVFQPAADRAVLYGAGEAYSTTNLVFEKALPKILGSRRIYVPLMEVSVKNAQRLAVGTRIAGTALGIAGIALAGNDIKNNGVTTSNSLDLVMSVLAVSPTGWGQAIAGTYFIANGITTLVTGKDIGQHIEGAVNTYYNNGVRAEEQKKYNAAMGY